MNNETQELENKTQDGSTEQQGVDTTKEDQTFASASEETKEPDYKAEFEKVQTTLQKAEHTIVELKKELKAKESAGDDQQGEQDLRQKIAELETKVENLSNQQVAASEHEQTVEELRKAQTRVGELSQSLIAKHTLPNSGAGNNQDKAESEPEIKLSPMDEQLLQRAAAKKGMTVQEYKKQMTPRG
ncbi:MAG: hypothetical protein ACLGJB_17805 [Blastocatellia bacterium]